MKPKQPITKALDDDSIGTSAAVMRDQKISSRNYSISDTFQFLAAVLLPVGMGAVIAAAKEATLGAVMAAFTAPSALIFLGAAAICTAVAITSRYAASRAYQRANYNCSEVNAKHTAQNIVKELKGAVVEMHNDYQQQVYEQNCRADGKQWRNVVRPEPVPAQEVAQLPSH